MCEVNIETLKEKTIQGDIDSMNELARCYTMGIGVDIDYNMALIYLQQAANLGNHLAMANLAIFYAQGICKDRDIKKALDLFHKAACQGANIRETVFQYIDKRDLHRLALEGCSSAEYYYALTLGNDEEAKRDALILSASNKKLALATGALAFKRFLANPTLSNFEAKKLFQQAVDNGYDYFQMLNQIALTVRQVDLENKFNICDIVRSFIEEKYERPFILVKITSKKWAEKLVIHLYKSLLSKIAITVVPQQISKEYRLIFLNYIGCFANSAKSTGTAENFVKAIFDKVKNLRRKYAHFGLFPLVTQFPGAVRRYARRLRRECRRSAPGNTDQRGSAGLAISKHELQLAEDQVPILASGVPMLYDPL